jgi:predicted DNA-binding transcriptional regulator YafY
MKRIFGLLQDRKYPNCSKMAAEFAVSAKTARRDIEFMRDRWELPIEYDKRKFGFYFTKPVERFPGVPVTEKELFALCVAHKAIEQYQGTVLQQPLELAFQKCMGQLDDQERFTLQNLDEVMSFRPFAPEDADLRLFELITEAIRERRGLRFEYRKPGDKVAEVRRVNPYHLMQFNNRWYLLALDLKHAPSNGADLRNKSGVPQRLSPGLRPPSPTPGGEGLTEGIRKFVLGRMRATQMTEDRFEVPEDFDAKKFFDHSLGVMTGAGDYEVVIELDAWLTDVLRGRRWHPSQVWTELPGGGSHLRMRLSCLEEIEQWVLSWGTRATVLQPTELCERLFKTTEELWQRYGGPGILHESVVRRGSR